jgi:hypothetical protein
MVFSNATERSFGRDTPQAQRVLARRALFVSKRCFADTGLTTANFATTFGGDVTAAATAFVRATQSLNRPIDLDH